MADRKPRFEIVRNAPRSYHVRFRGANGRVVWWTESYTRRGAAVDAIVLIAGKPVLRHPDGTHTVRLHTRITEVRDVDERPPS